VWLGAARRREFIAPLRISRHHDAATHNRDPQHFDFERNPGHFDAEDAAGCAIGVDAVPSPGGPVPPVRSADAPSALSTVSLVLASSSSRWRWLMQASTMRCLVLTLRSIDFAGDLHHQRLALHVLKRTAPVVESTGFISHVVLPCFTST